ncbi:MAG: DUF3096 domain-containing protein [Sulfobacillus acidophilus]|uniref:DUF3096 domain-containing protein n=1 Tax=Sulfobacillus acidophilus TaxID=53633 RepID=A0A2T2WD09_9FIRM|nr:MAG: DUF3096 domain-containing protein [Sulfobacillus acidophilus]
MLVTTDFLRIPATIALVAGLVILWRPQLLNYVVAIYLITTGLLGLIH